MDLEFSRKASPEKRDPRSRSTPVLYSQFSHSSSIRPQSKSSHLRFPSEGNCRRNPSATSTWTCSRKILSPGSPKPRLVFTPSSLDNIATVPPPFHSPVIAVERSTFGTSITPHRFGNHHVVVYDINNKQVVHGPSVSALYHRIIFFPYHLYPTRPASPLPDLPLLI